MTDEELIETLRAAAEQTAADIALSILLTIAAERLEEKL